MGQLRRENGGLDLRGATRGTDAWLRARHCANCLCYAAACRERALARLDVVQLRLGAS